MANGKTSIRVNLSSDDTVSRFSFDTYDTPYFSGFQTLRYLDRTSRVGVTNARYSGVTDDTTGVGNRLYQCDAVDYNMNMFNARLTYSLYWRKFDGEWQKPLLIDHMDAIAGALGVVLSWNCVDDFQVPCDEPLIIQNKGTPSETCMEKHTGTLAQLIDRLIGWSREIPTLQYCVRLTGNNLIVFQRGEETKTVDLDTTGAVRKYPVINKKLKFTQWNADGSDTQYIYSSDNSLTKEPFTGQISFGGQTLTYADGYLQSEVMTNAEGTVTTNYTYTDASIGTNENIKYLARKEVIDTVQDTRVVTEYTYFDTANEKYLGKELETHYSSASGSSPVTDTVTLTTHTPIGNGWFGTTVYDKSYGENEVMSTSLGQGAPGGRVSQYMVDAQQEGLTDNSDINQRRASIGYGVAKMRATYPVYDINTLNRIARAINNLNGKYEYTANLEVYNLSNVIDIDTKILFDGVAWFLQSNDIEVTPFHTVQRLNLIRWDSQ